MRFSAGKSGYYSYGILDQYLWMSAIPSKGKSAKNDSYRQVLYLKDLNSTHRHKQNPSCHIQFGSLGQWTFQRSNKKNIERTIIWKFRKYLVKTQVHKYRNANSEWIKTQFIFPKPLQSRERHGVQWQTNSKNCFRLEHAMIFLC